MTTETDKHDQEAERYYTERLKELGILREANRRLNAELPKMRNENKRLMAFLQNAAAYIRVMDGTENNITLATLVHDITGMANDEPCFLPRVTGYAEAEKDTKL